MGKHSTPPLDEFIDLAQRRRGADAHGYPAMENRATVAVYDTRAGNQTLNVRISDDLARKYGLIEGAKMTCSVHPDQQYIALKPGHGKGAALFRPKSGRSIVYQTTLRTGTLSAQAATEAILTKVDDALIIAITTT